VEGFAETVASARRGAEGSTRALMADVISAPICGFYRGSTIVAMIGLMLYRRSDYGGVSAITLGSRVDERIERESAVCGRPAGSR